MAFNLTPGQWYTAKYRYSYTGESGTSRIAEIHEDGYDNTVSGVTTIVASGRGSVATRYELEGDDEYAPFRPSTTTLSFFDSNGDLVSDLLAQLNTVTDKYAIVLREGDTLGWIGYVDPGTIEINEQGPVAIKIQASCGLKKRLDERPFIDDPSSVYQANEGAITLTSAVAKMLGELNYGLDFYVAGTFKPKSTNFTAIDGDEKCPLRYVWTNELAFTSGKDNEYGIISNKAALKTILEVFGMTIFQSKGAWHLTQVNLRHGATFRRWAFDSDGLDVDLGGGNNFETFDPRISLTDEDLESTLTTARFAEAYSSVITQYQHGKVRYVRRPGFSVGTIQEAENLFAGNNPWTTSGTATILPFINDDLGCRITSVDADIEGTTGYAEVNESTSEIDEVYANADDSLGAFTTLIGGNTVAQTTATVYAGTSLRFFASAYCDAFARNRTRPDYILFQLKHNGDSKYAYFKTDGSLGWQAGANWCVLKNMGQKDDWLLLKSDFTDATTADGTIDITLAPIFEDESGRNIGDPASFEYIWWDNVDIKPILGSNEKDTEATSVVNFVNGARSNPHPRTVVMRLGDGPSAANRSCLFTDILLTTPTANWEQTAAAHSGTDTGVGLARIVGAAMLKSMNQFRRIREGAYPGRGSVLTPLDTINSDGDLYVPLELDINWATEITGGKWYLANEQAFTSDLVEGISTGFSGFTNRGNGQSSTSGALLNRIGSSFDTMLARESDRLATVSAAATSGTTVSCTALAEDLNAGDPVFFQNKKTGYVMKRIVAADAAATDTSFTVTSAFTASEALTVGDPILPGSIAGLRIDMDGVQIVNTHLKNDGIDAFNGTIQADGTVNAGDEGTLGWAITRAGIIIANELRARGKIVAGDVYIGKDVGDLDYTVGPYAGTAGEHGIWINPDNYWIIDTNATPDKTHFRVGDSTAYMEWDETTPALKVVSSGATVFDSSTASTGLSLDGDLEIVSGKITLSGAGTQEMRWDSSGLTYRLDTSPVGSPMQIEWESTGGTAYGKVYYDDDAFEMTVLSSSGGIVVNSAADIDLRASSGNVSIVNTAGTYPWPTDAPNDGEVLTWNTGGTMTWEAPPSGVTTFVALTDTPANFTSSGEYFVKVNAGETALEFVADPGYITGVSNLTDIGDVSGTPADKHIIYYDAGGPGWVSQTLASSLGDQNVSSLINDAGYTTNTGDITAVTTSATSGLDGGVSSGDAILTLDFSRLTAGTAGDHAAGTLAFITAGGNMRKIATGTVNVSAFNNDASYVASGANISVFTNDAGYTTNTGDITAVNTGVTSGLDGGVTTGDANITLDFSRLTAGTAGDFATGTVAFVTSGGNMRNLAASSVNISTFNNDSGFTTNTGTVTEVISGLGTGISVASATTTPTLTLDLDELSAGTISSFAGISAGGSTIKQAISGIALSSFNDDLSYAAASHTHAATDITSGTLNDARLSSNVNLLDSGQTITGVKTFEGPAGGDIVYVKHNANATVGTQTVDSPRIAWQGSYWNGVSASTATVDNYADIVAIDPQVHMVWEHGGVTFKMDFDTPEFLVNGTALTSNAGTVTNVTAGVGLSGGSITTSGTIDLDFASLTTGAASDFATGYLAFETVPGGNYRKIVPGPVMADIVGLADPGADRILFWDDSANDTTWLATGDGLSITGTTIAANTGNGLKISGGAITIDATVAAGTGGYGGDTDTLTLVTDDGTTVLILCEAV